MLSSDAEGTYLWGDLFLPAPSAQPLVATLSMFTVLKRSCAQSSFVKLGSILPNFNTPQINLRLWKWLPNFIKWPWSSYCFAVAFLIALHSSRHEGVPSAEESSGGKAPSVRSTRADARVLLWNKYSPSKLDTRVDSVWEKMKGMMVLARAGIPKVLSSLRPAAWLLGAKQPFCLRLSPGTVQGRFPDDYPGLDSVEPIHQAAHVAAVVLELLWL